MKTPKLLLSLLVRFHFPMRSLFSPYSSNALLPIKKGGKIWGVYRFLSIQIPISAIMMSMTTAAIMTSSAVLNRGSSDSGSGSAGAGPTDKPVASYELQ